MAASLLLLLIALSPFSASADVTWSIDCGASSSYIDDNLITWQGDETLISAGQSRTVRTTNSGHVVSTLREFTSGKKNCYVLEGEKGAKLLLRASFFYGNYDGKSSPPSFDIQIDGNDWATVVTNMNSENYVYHELTYVSKGDSISLCLVQTKSNQYPFISALEVRTLGSSMYKHFEADQALRLAGRHAFGAVNTVRYPSDGYDRIWGASILTGTQYTSVTGSAVLIDTTTVDDNPPLRAVENAYTTSSSSASLMKMALSDLDSTPSSVYLNLYFSEVSSLGSTDKRSFTVYLDDRLMSSTKGGISPAYGSVGEITIYNTKASNSTTITLQSTSDSTLPPIINAVEVFQVIKYTAYSVGAGSPGTSPSGSGSPPSSTSSDTETSTDSSSGKKKSSLPLILGAGIPGFLLLVAFVVVLVTMQLKRRRAAMAATTTGGTNGQQVMMAAQSRQGEMSEFKVNVVDQRTGQEHASDQLTYGSPAPLLNQTR